MLLKDKIDYLTDRIAELKEENRVLKQDLEEMNDRNEELRGRIGVLKSELTAAEELAVAYRIAWLGLDLIGLQRIKHMNIRELIYQLHEMASEIGTDTVEVVYKRKGWPSDPIKSVGLGYGKKQYNSETDSSEYPFIVVLDCM